MTRPSRRGKFLPLNTVQFEAGTDNGADGIDWDTGEFTPITEGVTVEESDGSPSVANVDTIKLDASDFTLVDNADGSVSVTTTGASYSPVSVTDDGGDHYYLWGDGDGTPVLVEV
jgi:hypothetical protein